MNLVSASRLVYALLIIRMDFSNSTASVILCGRVSVDHTDEFDADPSFLTLDDLRVQDLLGAVNHLDNDCERT